MKLAVLGPGALGCLVAALFWEAGVEVSLVDYRPERVARLRLRGIQVHTLDGGPRVVKVPIGLAAGGGALRFNHHGGQGLSDGNRGPGPAGPDVPGGHGPDLAEWLGQPGMPWPGPWAPSACWPG